MSRYSHFDLPAGTVLTFVSRLGNMFRVELLDGIFEGHSRRVNVLEAPIEYDPSREPTIMCVVPSGTTAKLMTHVYEAAIKTVGSGDVVRLLDRHVDAEIRPFEVQSVEISG